MSWRARARAVVRWHTGWVWAAMFTLTAGASFANRFGLAYFALIVLSVYSIGAWIYSDSLKSKRPRKILVHLPRGGSVVDLRIYRYWLFTPPLVIALVASIGWLYIQQMQFAEELRGYKGKLFPASDPMPTNPCSDLLAPDDLTLFVGSNSFVPSFFPYPILAVAKQPVLSVDRNIDGSMAVLLDVRSRDGKIIVSFTHDGFIVNQNNILEMQRPDKSTLIVVDQEKRQMIKARYINPKAFVLNGYIVFPDHGKVLLGNPQIADGCFFHSGPAIDIR